MIVMMTSLWVVFSKNENHFNAYRRTACTLWLKHTVQTMLLDLGRRQNTNSKQISKFNQLMTLKRQNFTKFAIVCDRVYSFFLLRTRPPNGFPWSIINLTLKISFFISYRYWSKVLAFSHWLCHFWASPLKTRKKGGHLRASL